MERRSPNEAEYDPALRAIDRMIHIGREQILKADSETAAAEIQLWVDEWLQRRDDYLREFYGLNKPS